MLKCLTCIYSDSLKRSKNFKNASMTSHLLMLDIDRRTALGIIKVIKEEKRGVLRVEM